MLTSQRKVCFYIPLSWICIFVVSLISTAGFTQSDINSDENFYKYVDVIKDQECKNLNTDLYSLEVDESELLEYLAKLTAFGKCLLAEKKIEESEKALSESIKLATEKGYYQIARNGLHELGVLFSFYKSDQMVEHSLRKITFDSTYSSKKQLLVSRKELLFTYSYLNQDKNALDQANIIIETAIDSISLCDGYFGKALSLSNIEPLQADSFYLKTIDFSRSRDSFSRSSHYKRYGNFLLSQGRKIEAIDYLIDGIDLTPKDKRYDLSRTGSLNNLAQLFLGLKQYDRTRQYIDESIRICEKNSYKSRNAMTALINAQLLKEEGKIDLAKQEIINSKKYYGDRKDLRGVISNLTIEAEIAMLEQNEDWLKSTNRSMDSILSLDNKFEIPLQVYGIKAKMAARNGTIKEKEKSFNKFYQASLVENDPIGKYYSLAGLYGVAKDKGDYKQALTYLEKNKALSEEIYQTEQLLTVNKMESDYNRKGQDLKIAALDQENILKEKTVSIQSKAITGSAIALSLLAILSFFLFRINRKVNSQKAIIEKALGEKDILLREIHHRVKNNLQLVSSLLTIQSKDVKDEQALEALHIGKSRVKSMSLIHQDLYQKEKLTGINVKTYLEKLSSELFNTYNISKDQIDLNLDIENIDLDVDTLVPLGLIINELITNALKYAFPQGREGSLSIKFEMDNNALKLTVKDDGIGLSESMASSKSFGNTLIKALTKQLNGTMNVDGTNGTNIELSFLDYKLAA